ncbi:hypothetical protein C900_04983 [Fulvivirga imtechensis AK7]|uniref:AraC effector-binding domain-containing protein n=1 Tax=Fulvivirga imtechensis AK7 TaxID=1237149 RepID=L8JKJ8_9BACT|nr:hypothetical protein C900_04983 [Fulvivirga imtechensis AK7]
MILTIVLLAVVISLFLPAKTELERSIVINAPVESIFAEVNDLKKWPNWSPWNEMDPTMAMTYADKTAGEGASYSWEGDPNITGTGKLTITESRENEYIATDLDFGQQDTAIGYYTFENTGEGTKVTWGFETDHGWNPLSRWIGAVFIEPMLGPTFEDGLENLKTHVESLPSLPSDDEVSIVEVQPITYIGLGAKLDASNSEVISSTMADLYGRLMQYSEESGAEITGAPIAVYKSLGEEDIEVVCGLPVSSGTTIMHQDIKVDSTLGGEAVKAVHKGSYEKLPATYDKMNIFIDKNRRQAIGQPYELYITDPEEVTDTTQWITEVYFPIGRE